MRRSRKKLQSAMEYLTTYGWAILVIAIGLGIVATLGVLNPTALVPNQCLFPEGISCQQSYLTTNGILTFSIKNTIQYPINITGVGCNTNKSSAQPQSVPVPILLPSGSNITIAVQCYSGAAQLKGNINTQQITSVAINYTEVQSGVKHTTYGRTIESISTAITTTYTSSTSSVSTTFSTTTSTTTSTSTTSTSTSTSTSTTSTSTSTSTTSTSTSTSTTSTTSTTTVLNDCDSATHIDCAQSLGCCGPGQSLLATWSCHGYGNLACGNNGACDLGCSQGYNANCVPNLLC